MIIPNGLHFFHSPFLFGLLSEFPSRVVKTYTICEVIQLNKIKMFLIWKDGKDKCYWKEFILHSEGLYFKGVIIYSQ